MFFVSVASKGVRVSVSSLFSTLARGPVSVDSKSSWRRILGISVSVGSNYLSLYHANVGRFHGAEGTQEAGRLLFRDGHAAGRNESTMAGQLRLWQVNKSHANREIGVPGQN